MRALFLLAIGCCWASDPTVILRQKCFGCHNTEHMRKAVVPGDPDASKLMRMISGAPPKMPLGGTPLTKEQVAELRGWIQSGAKWPDEQWWSLRPLQKPAGSS